MAKVLAAGIALLLGVAVIAPAIAADVEVTPRRERAAPSRQAAQPARTQQTRTQQTRTQQASNQQTQSSNWNGGQLGGSNGASSVNNNFVEPGAYNVFGCGSPVNTFGCYETPFQFKKNTVTYTVGAFAGYRVQMGFMVVGVEGDIYWQNAETSQTQFSSPRWLCCGETFTGSTKVGTNGSLRLRAGHLINPDTLLYVTGGVAIAEIQSSFSYYAAGTYIVQGAASWTETRVGGTVGAGAETQVWSGVKLRGEYRFSNYGSSSKDVPLSNNSFGRCDPSFCGTTAHIDLRSQEHKFTVGLGVDLPGI